MTNGNYRQFGSVAMAAEVLCSRWTIVVVCELLRCSARFNDLRGRIPRMSPALLSKRLKDLERDGVVECVAICGVQNGHEYRLTPIGREIEPVLRALAAWEQRWAETAPSP